MGKSTPRAPAAPDPVVTANAQASANADTARLQANINNVNTIGPDGSVTYTPIGNDRWQQVTTLSDAQQGIYDASNAAQVAALGVANKEIGLVDSVLGQKLDTKGVPGLTGSVQPTTLSAQLGFTPAQSMGWGSGQAVQGSIPAGPPVETAIAGAGAVQTGYGSGGPVLYGTGMTPGDGLVKGVTPSSLQGAFSTGGPVQASVGPGGELVHGYDPGGQVL